jgi:DNA-binding transcriptional LysR family regulator
MSLRELQSLLAPEDLRLIRSIAGAGSLAGAARAAGIDHSSAYRRLGAIEARLGVRLFDRARDGYAATPAGELAVAAGARVLDELAALDRQLAGRDLKPVGTVRVTLPDTLVETMLPPVARFRSLYPGITVELAADNAFYTLVKRDADIAIRPAPSAPEGLVARRVATVGMAIYGAKKWRNAGPGAAPWVAPDDTLAHIGAARWIARNVPDARIALRASSLRTLHDAVRAGLGLSVLPCFRGDGDKALIRFGAPMAELAHPLWLVTHPDLRKAARIRAFLDFAARELATLKKRFDGSAA